MLRQLRRLVMPISAALTLCALLWTLGWAEPSQAAGTILYVDPGGSDSAACGSVGTPCRTLQYAVETRAATGDTVLAAAGIYTDPFALQANVTVRSAAGPATTLIDGEGVRGPMVTASNMAVTETARLEGFTVTRSDDSGMAVENASPVISDCVFLQNNGGFGGGLKVSGAAAVVSVYASEFLSNVITGDGGGIWVSSGASLYVVDSHFAFNHGNSWGGGILGNSAQIVKIDDSRFEHNRAGNLPIYSGYGGGLMAAGGTALYVDDSEFLSNTAGTGGGLDIREAPHFTLTMLTVRGNTADRAGGIEAVDSLGVLSASQIVSNTATEDRGGGLLVSGGVLTVAASTLQDNSGGGLLASGQSRATIFNNFIVANVSQSPPQGQVRLESSAGVTLTYNTLAGDSVNHGVSVAGSGVHVIANNIIAGHSSGIQLIGAATASLHNNLLWNNALDYDNVAPGQGDVLMSPDFVDAVNDNYHLGVFSWAVDAAGDVAGVGDDYDGDARPFDGNDNGQAVADIGADERMSQTPALYLPMLSR